MARYLCAGALLLAGSACEIVDRVRTSNVAVDTAAKPRDSGGVTLKMQAPGVLRPGEEGAIRLTITSHGDTVPRDLRLELLVPGWMEPLPPEPGDREVAMAASEDAGVRFTYRMDSPPLRPGQTVDIEQRIRVPPSAPPSPGTMVWGRVVSARLVGPEGRAVAEVESEVARGDSVSGDAPTAQSAEARDRLGPIRLGMGAAGLRQSAPSARDTAWTREDTPERGIVIPLGLGGTAVAVLGGDTVTRIEVRDTLPRTREGLGVGASLAQLRAAYGPACAGAGEDRAVVWFAAAPGVTFALDSPPEPAQRLHATARVTHWWLHPATRRCP